MRWLVLVALLGLVACGTTTTRSGPAVATAPPPPATVLPRDSERAYLQTEVYRWVNAQPHGPLVDQATWQYRYFLQHPELAAYWAWALDELASRNIYYLRDQVPADVLADQALIEQYLAQRTPPWYQRP
jgi:hypothetical protein